MSKDPTEINKEITLFKKYVKKIKLRKAYEILDITPNEYQEELIYDWDNHFDDYHTFTTTIGRRGGKSFSAGILGATHLQVPFASIALIAPTMKLTEIIWNEVTSTLMKLGVKPVKINSQSKSLTMENGATLQAGSVQSPESLVGKKYTLLIVDESCLDSNLKDMLEMQVMPATTDFGLIEETGIPYSKLLLFSTPRGKNNVHYEYHMNGVKKVKGYKSYQVSSLVNPLVTQAFLDGMKAKMDDLIFKQEYLAQFVDVAQNSALHSFNSDKNTFNISEISTFIPELTIISGIDIGFKDASAQVLVAKAKGKYYCFDAEAIAQVDTKTIYDTFYAMERKWNVTPEVRYIDKSAALTAYDLASIYNFTTYPGKNDRKLGIAILNQLFREGNLLIEESLYELIQEVETLSWNSTGKDFVREKKHHHDMVHSLRYSVVSDYHNYETSQDIIVL